MADIASPIDGKFDTDVNPVISADAVKVASAAQIYPGGGMRVITDAEGEKLQNVEPGASANQSYFETLETPVSPRMEAHDEQGRIMAEAATQYDLAQESSASVYEALDGPRNSVSVEVHDNQHRVVASLVKQGDITPFNAERMRRTSMKIRQLRSGVSAQFREIVIGDSWAQSGLIWGRNYAQVMWADLEKAATGFFPADNNASVDALLDVTAYGTWAGNNDRSTFYPTPDMINRRSSTAGDNVVIAADTALGVPTGVKLFFTGTADGQIRYRYGTSGAWSDAISTVGVGDLVVIDLPTLPVSPGWTLQFEVAAGTISWGGGFIDSDADGVVLNFAGFGGTTSAHWLAPDAAQWQAGIAAIGADLVTILLGTNDKLTDSTPAQFASNIGSIVRRVRSALPATDGTPEVDVLVLLPANIASDEDGWLYAQALIPVAAEDGFAVIDLARIFGANFADYAGWFEDDNHPDPASGGWLIADSKLKIIGL